MSNKEVVIEGGRPSATRKKSSDDAWVGKGVEKEESRRLTIEVPASLHGRIKAVCAVRGVKMVEELTRLLEREYPPS